jgi:hypothetical protein
VRLSRLDDSRLGLIYEEEIAGTTFGEVMVLIESSPSHGSKLVECGDYSTNYAERLPRAMPAQLKTRRYLDAL